EALQTHGFAQGVDLLVAYGLRNSTWELVVRAAELFTVRFQSIESTDVQFKEVSAVPNFMDRITQCYDFLSEKNLDVKPDLDFLLRLVVQRSIGLFDRKDAVLILDHVKDPIAYESFIQLCMERGQKKLAGDMYLRYRVLPVSRVRIFILRSML